MFSLATMMNDIYNASQKDNPWINSSYEKINALTNDARGKFGEQLISAVFHQIPCRIDQDISDNSVHPDGHYDLKVDGVRIEVKTSANLKNWQHEPLYAEDMCDVVIFVDFTPESYNVSFILSDDLPLGKNSPLMPNKHGTLRKNKDDGYKLDFSKKTFMDLKLTGVCETFSPNEEEKLVKFIQKMWSDFYV